MANPWRGEVDVTVDGVTYPARLTLGALAELEGALVAGSLVDLVQRFEARAFTARDVIVVLAAGLRSAGWDGTQETLGRAEFGGGPIAAARAAAELLVRAFAFPGEG